MKTKKEIVANWLPRYTGRELNDFSKYILLTNFDYYLTLFASHYNVPIVGQNLSMPNVRFGDITLINFGMGSPNAATIMDLLSAIKTDGVLFIGKCGAIDDNTRVGDYILPIAAIKGEGTSDDYLPKEVPALPSFNIQKACSKALADKGCKYTSGVVYTTNRRVWEHDETFKSYLKQTRALGVDMECATLFTVGYFNGISVGALILTTDRPMISEGIKTAGSDKKVSELYVYQQIEIAIEAIKTLKENQLTAKDVIF